MIEISNGKESRTWQITIFNPGLGEDVEVDSLFDSSGSETFDPTQAVEANTSDGLRSIEVGDEILFTLIQD